MQLNINPQPFVVRPDYDGFNFHAGVSLPETCPVSALKYSDDSCDSNRARYAINFNLFITCTAATPFLTTPTGCHWPAIVTWGGAVSLNKRNNEVTKKSFFLSYLSKWQLLLSVRPIRESLQNKTACSRTHHKMETSAVASYLITLQHNISYSPFSVKYNALLCLVKLLLCIGGV